MERRIVQHAATWGSQLFGGSPRTLRVGDTVYVGGQIALATSGEMVGADSIATQTQQVFESMEALLREAGVDMADLVKLHTYYVFHGQGPEVTSYWERMTAVRLRYLAHPGPAATALRVEGVPLAKLLIGIDGIATVARDKRRIMPEHAWDWSMPTPFSQGWV